MLFGKKKGADVGGTSSAAVSNGEAITTSPEPAQPAPPPSPLSGPEAKSNRILSGPNGEAAVQLRKARVAGLGAMVNLLMRAPVYRDLRLSDLEWLVLPAVATGQYLISEKRPSADHPGGLAAMLLWARVSPEVDRRLAASTETMLRLEPRDWRSGDILWVIEVLGHKDAVPQMLAQFRRAVVKDAPVRMRVGGPDGYRVLELPASDKRHEERCN